MCVQAISTSLCNTLTVHVTNMFFNMNPYMIISVINAGISFLTLKHHWAYTEYLTRWMSVEIPMGSILQNTSHSDSLAGNTSILLVHVPTYSHCLSVDTSTGGRSAVACPTCTLTVCQRGPLLGVDPLYNASPIACLSVGTSTGGRSIVERLIHWLPVSGDLYWG